MQRINGNNLKQTHTQCVSRTRSKSVWDGV